MKPPWGTMNAIDLNRARSRGRCRSAKTRRWSQRGRRNTGTENYGGPIVTAGGLIFIGATKDEKFRALDKRTGQVLWETQLPAGGYATPSTYVVNGKQYIVIAAGGGKMGTKSGDAYVGMRCPTERHRLDPGGIRAIPAILTPIPQVFAPVAPAAGDTPVAAVLPAIERSSRRSARCRSPIAPRPLCGVVRRRHSGDAQHCRERNSREPFRHHALLTWHRVATRLRRAPRLNRRIRYLPYTDRWTSDRR